VEGQISGSLDAKVYRSTSGKKPQKIGKLEVCTQEALKKLSSVNYQARSVVLNFESREVAPEKSIFYVSGESSSRAFWGEKSSLGGKGGGRICEGGTSVRKKIVIGYEKEILRKKSSIGKGGEGVPFSGDRGINHGLKHMGNLSVSVLEGDD